MTKPNDPVIIANNLTRRFGAFTAVNRVSFTVQRGEIVGYLGPNGSGKTTTIRMLLGLLAPSDGSSTVLGFDSFRQSEELRARAGYMSQKFAIYDDLTVWENLQFYSGVYNIRNKKRISETIDLVGLSRMTNTLTHQLSGGWRQRLALGIALVHQPELLFLDEPTSGVDPNARRTFWDLIYQLSEAGVTILVTTHYMDEAEYCHRVGMMRDGSLLALDGPENLKHNHIQGDIWELEVEPLMDGLLVLEKTEGILRTALSGDRVRVMSRKGLSEYTIKQSLRKSNIKVTHITRGTPTFEDVFLSISR